VSSTQLILRQLPFVIGADARRGEVERRALLLRDLRDGRVDLLGRKGEPVCGERHAVEALGQLQNRRVATPAHVVDDRGDGVLDLRRILALHRQKRGEPRIEIRIRRVQEYRHTHLSAPTGAFRLASPHLTAPARRVKPPVTPR
jgi:hypothetical protein